MRAWALIVIVCVAVLAAGTRVAAAQQSGSSTLVPSVPWLGTAAAPSREPSHPATLPDTGDDIVWQLIVGAALVGGGVAALRIRHR